MSESTLYDIYVEMADLNATMERIADSLAVLAGETQRKVRVEYRQQCERIPLLEMRIRPENCGPEPMYVEALDKARQEAADLENAHPWLKDE